MTAHTPDNASDDADMQGDNVHIGGEKLELYPAPHHLVEHRAFESMFSHDYDVDFDAQLDGVSRQETSTETGAATEVTAKCVVSARLRLARFRTIEFLELSKATDDIAALYPNTVWIKMRGIYGMHLIVMVALWAVAFVAGFVVAIQATHLWHMGLAAMIVVAFMRLSQRVMMGRLIKESPWYNLPYNSW